MRQWTGCTVHLPPEQMALLSTLERLSFRRMTDLTVFALDRMIDLAHTDPARFADEVTARWGSGVTTGPRLNLSTATFGDRIDTLDPLMAEAMGMSKPVPVARMVRASLLSWLDVPLEDLLAEVGTPPSMRGEARDLISA